MDGDIQIRIANFEDYLRLTELSGQLGYSISSKVLLEQLKAILLNDEHQVYVAETASGYIVGWVHIYIYRLFYANLMSEIGGLVVDERYRCLGIGRKLLEHAETWAIKKGTAFVSLRSNVIRKEAHLFYEKVGYRRVKEQFTFRKELQSG